MLDLGCWMSVQSEVEVKHQLLVMQPDVLAETIESSFYGLDENILTRIHDRWLKVLKLIVQGKGSNQLVEKCRKKEDKVE